MSTLIVSALRSLVRRYGIDVVRYKPPVFNTELGDAFRAFNRLRDFAERQPDLDELAFIDFCSHNYRLSKSQLFQDLFVQYELGRKQHGFFVEFGATNGIDLSNTYLLERHYQWRGILAEPAKCWHGDLQRNRSCVLDFRCVWDKDGQQLQFNEVADAELSTVEGFASNDMHARTRQHAERYAVPTVSLNALLHEHHAPTEIDYLSVDTEGSELKILSAFDFDRYRIKIISVEHNYTAERDAIHALLCSKGFSRKFEAYSQWDDWYVASKK